MYEHSNEQKDPGIDRSTIGMEYQKPSWHNFAKRCLPRESVRIIDQTSSVILSGGTLYTICSGTVKICSGTVTICSGSEHDDKVHVTLFESIGSGNLHFETLKICQNPST